MDKLKISVEKLHHFQCPLCSKWWSIGDAPVEQRTGWYCPWCGEFHSTKSPNDNFNRVRNFFNKYRPSTNKKTIAEYCYRDASYSRGYYSDPPWGGTYLDNELFGK
jgi:predicted RNA-binding Zn-ribbon protein involved in translation (DUF1610 family)